MQPFHPEKIFAADDWGLSPAVNEAILELARRGHLLSVSCMAGLEFTGYRIGELAALGPEGPEIFLHFNLTFGNPLSPAAEVPSLGGKRGFHSHPVLLARSLSGRIRAGEAAKELTAQWNALERLGVTIAGVDGHHHIHLLPAISSAVARFLAGKSHLRARMMVDRSHWPSYLLSAAFRMLRGGAFERVQECLYLRPSDLRSKEAFFGKLMREPGKPLVIHPSARDDFDRHRVRDGLKAQRVVEFEKILNYLS